MRKFYFILTLLVVFAGACKKETGIGADLLPGNDLLSAKNTDTFTLYTKTVADGALRSDKLSKVYLGVINDPIFGFQKSSFAIELDRGDVILDDTLKPYIVDSVVLFIKYNTIFGDSTIGQDFNISTISTKIDENTAYYSNNTSFTPTTLLANITNYKFSPSQKVGLFTTDTIGTPGIFRAVLPNSFATDLLSKDAIQLRDSLYFKNYLPGILVENSNNNGNAMAEMDLSSVYSGIYIFYKDKKNTQRIMRLKTSESVAFNGQLRSRQNGINFFNNTLSSTVQNVVSSGLVSDSVNYLLGQSGSLLKISLPTIGNLGKVAVNKAILSVTQIQNNSQKDLYAPFALLLLKRNTSGNLEAISTFNNDYKEGYSYADSVATDGSGNKLLRYSFNLSKYIQNIASGKETNTDLYIANYGYAGIDGSVNTLGSSALFFNYSPARLVLAGSNYSDPRFKMKLNIIYTLLK
jgi:hypothetical protein